MLKTITKISLALTKCHPEELVSRLADDVRHGVHAAGADCGQRLLRQEPLLAEVLLHHRPPDAHRVEPKLLLLRLRLH